MITSLVNPDLKRAPDLVAESGSTLGRPMHLLGMTTSTSDEAKRAAKDGAPHGATWVAEQQTAGRGRQGRAWVSPRGENLLFSVLLRVACPPSRLPPLALVAGLAVRDAVARAAPDADVHIKWPNDVLVGGRKLAGVLVEAITIGSRVEAVVIGVGINVHTRAFPEELEDRATSVSLVARDPPDRATILADVLAGLDRDLHVVVSRGLGLVGRRLEASDALHGRRVRSDAGDEGIASGIDEEGRLLVRRDDGVMARWSAGEVHLV
jgi:BirA family transcriptional regulator, biotin operon repressor / biotin---[acetyl-CoA-carboxylase] ligase